ncbi:MAG: arginine/lysine/histidine transporter system substrate-binding protein [Solirubrobacterales bacterium]|jgi:ABC-type amino acid transport substrate-binding protein|nr:arginine/lysine/histidine transporter system substrate-binding protein [Solirubrobacterales bacterium]
MSKARMQVPLAAVAVLVLAIVAAGCGSSGSKGSDIKSVADLKGKILGAQKGTTGAEKAKSYGASSIRTYAGIDDAFNALENGQVDAVVNDFPVSKYAERAHPNLKVIATVPTGEQYGLAFRKGSILKPVIDGTLAVIKKDGTYTRIYRKWFKQDPPASILKSKATPIQEAAPPGSIATVGGSDTLLVGSDIPYPPFEFGKAPSYDGFDIDIVNAIGQTVGLKVRYQDTSFDTIFRDLSAGKFDMVSSATTITPERAKEVDFSEPYFPADQSIMVKE